MIYFIHFEMVQLANNNIIFVVWDFDVNASESLWTNIGINLAFLTCIANLKLETFQLFRSPIDVQEVWLQKVAITYQIIELLKGTRSFMFRNRKMIFKIADWIFSVGIAHMLYKTKCVVLTKAYKCLKKSSNIRS